MERFAGMLQSHLFLVLYKDGFRILMVWREHVGRFSSFPFDHKTHLSKSVPIRSVPVAMTLDSVDQ